MMPCIKKLAKYTNQFNSSYKFKPNQTVPWTKEPNFLKKKEEICPLYKQPKQMHPYLEMLGYKNKEQVEQDVRSSTEKIETRYIYYLIKNQEKLK